MSSEPEIILPPMPKLRPKPGLLQIHDLSNAASKGIPPSKKRKMAIEEPSCNKVHHEIIDEDAKTSRLLTKSECGRGKGGSGSGGGGGGRKRNGTTGSMIHSIPKFTQVRSPPVTSFLL